MSADTILEVHKLSRAFGGIRAVDNVSLSVGRGEIGGLIGPNGAGNTTLVNLMFSLSHRIFVLHQGALISEGKPSEVAEDERVIRAYLGTRFAERYKGLMRHG